MKNPELLAIDAEIKSEWLASRRIKPKMLGVTYLICGSLATLFSVLLTLDKLQLNKDANAKFGCDVNIFISCGSVMKTVQAELLGFPNSIIGIAGYAALMATGMALVAGFKPPGWFKALLAVGMSLVLVFVCFLFYISVFQLRTLCPYCTGVWLTSLYASAQTYAFFVQDSKTSYLVKNFFSHWLLNFGLIVMFGLALVIWQFMPLLLQTLN